MSEENPIIEFMLDGDWCIRFVKDNDVAKIEFNHEKFPEFLADDFAKLFLDRINDYVSLPTPWKCDRCEKPAMNKRFRRFVGEETGFVDSYFCKECFNKFVDPEPEVIL